MGIIQDLRFGIRAMVRNSTLTIVAIAALAVGIGLNGAVFSLVNAVLFKGLPFEDSHEIVHLNSFETEVGQTRGVSLLDFEDWRAETGSFEDIAAFMGISVNLSDDRSFPESVRGTRITWNTFRTVGQPVLMGRDFVEQDSEESAETIAMIGEGLWRRRYGADPNVIGTTVRANGLFFTIVGIMPLGMEFPNNASMWFVLRDGEEFADRNTRNLQVVGRLNEGVSIEQATAELAGITAGLEAQYPDTNENMGISIRTSSEFYNGGEIRTVFLALMGAVTFVLLIACANVGNLLLAQALRRTGETSVRTALGASRWRIVRQMLTECLVLSVAGMLAGLGLAFAGIELFDRAVSNIDGKPYWIDFSMDMTVFGYLAAISIGTAFLFGLVPALQASRANINDTLKDGVRGSAGGARSRRWTGALVISELTLTVVLLTGAGLMFRSFLNLQQVDLGVETDPIVLAQVVLDVTTYPEATDRAAFHDRLVEELAGIPGVEAATLTSGAPGLGAPRRPLTIPGRDIVDGQGQGPTVQAIGATPGYFETFGVELLQGRMFTDADGTESSRVAIVNTAFADRYWPDQDVIGLNVQLGTDAQNTGPLRVVGIAPPIRHSIDPGTAVLSIEPAVYVPLRQDPPNFINLVARTPLDPVPIMSGLRAAVRNVDPDLPAAEVRTYDDWRVEMTFVFRVFGSVFAILAGIALVLSSAGIFGVTSYSVDQRRQEIGMRVAMGASSENILWLITRRGIRQLLIGLVLGTAGAFGITRVLSGLMFGLGTSDPVTLAAVIVLLSVVTTVACVVPARRATRLDPVEAIRVD